MSPVRAYLQSELRVAAAAGALTLSRKPEYAEHPHKNKSLTFTLKSQKCINQNVTQQPHGLNAAEKVCVRVLRSICFSVISETKVRSEAAGERLNRKATPTLTFACSPRLHRCRWREGLDTKINRIRRELGENWTSCRNVHQQKRQHDLNPI